MVKVRVQIEILSDRELAVERERLRHVANVATRLHVVGAHRLSKQFRRTFGGGQEPRHHFHCRRFSAAVRAEEAENLAARDAKAHMIDRDENAKAAMKPIRLDRPGPGIRCDTRPADQPPMLGALFYWKERRSCPGPPCPFPPGHEL